MAAEVDFGAVLEFLRQNDLHECESALMEDIMEKSRFGSSEFEKFFFSVPPPLRIPATRRPLPRELTDGGDGWSSNCSSECEFVSADSSTTEFCFSDFTSLYGIHEAQPPSQASSDESSHFGTAQDYSDFDMQNDPFWYNDHDVDNAMQPDFDGDPSEDKFMMTVQTGEPVNNLLQHKLISASCKDCYELDGSFQLDKSEQDCNDYTRSAHFCSGYCGVTQVYAGNLVDYTLEKLKVTNVCDNKSGHPEEKNKISNTNLSNKRDSTNGWVVGLDFSPKKKNQPNENDNSTFMVDEVISLEHNEPNAALHEEDDAVADEDLFYNDKDEDYEVFNLRIIHRKNRTGFEENKELPIVLNSIIAGRYYITEFLGSAAFSRVVQAHDLCLGMDVCLKIIKNDKDFFDQSLDEIKLLKYVNKYDPADEHHILRLYDYFYYQEHLFIVTELLQSNLYEFQKYTQESGGEPYFTLPRLQVIAQQCLEALLYLHDLGIIHCDLKPENILIKSYRKCKIKVIDLGSSCFKTDNLSLYVQSRSYRGPEVMLGLPYNQKIDLWSLGCILAELYSGEVLFPNEAVVLLLARMIAMLGPIDMDMLLKGEETEKYFTEDYDLYYVNEETNELEYIIPDESSLEHHLQISDSLFADFLKYLLEINPERRPTVREALTHPWLSHTYYYE